MSNRAALSILLFLTACLPAVAFGQAEPAAPEVPAVTAPAAPAYPEVQPLSGLGVIALDGAAQFLFQGRQKDAGTEKIERFLTRRVQLALLGQPSEKTRYGIILDLTDGDLVEGAADGFEGRVREAWIGFDVHSNFSVDVGSFRPPWTLTMDDQVSDELFVRYPLLVAVNQFTPWRQTGGMVTGRGGDFFTGSVGLWNGLDNPDNFVDDNDMKDYMVTVKLEFYPGYRLYLGDWRGDTEQVTLTDTIPAEHNNVWLGAEIDRNGFVLDAEALWNRLAPDEGDNVNSFGYQVSMGYTYRTIQPTLRYEQFDPDNAIDSDEQEWTTLGVNLMLTPATRVTANYIFKAERNDNQVANDEFLLQISAWF